MRGGMHASRWLPLLALAAFAGCTAAQGASTSNFTLTPQSIGWDAGSEARFTLAIGASLLHSSPTFTIDRRLAIEEVELAEHGLKFGGDYSTKNPDDVGLRLERNGTEAPSFALDKDHPTLDLVLMLPAKLRDSEYALELKLFKVGWVKSDAFRVDAR
jgi:hypothetical protein